MRVHDGALQVARNGRPRPPAPAPPGLDVLTALFAHPECAASTTLHTGRHRYAAVRRAGAIGDSVGAGVDAPCRFRVDKDDGNSFDVDITFTERSGLRVPATIVGHRPLTARIELLDVPAPMPPAITTVPTAAKSGAARSVFATPPPDAAPDTRAQTH